MRRRDFAFGAAAFVGAAACLAGCADAEGASLLNASYDPTGDLYEAYNAWFVAGRRGADGRPFRVFMSHGGSGKQTRAVIDGLDADIVSLALQFDIDQIASKTGKIPANWRSLLPENSCPYTSTIVFLVRRGNPAGVRDWDDLARPGVSVVTPSPKTSGGARWNYLAAWAYADRKFGRDETRIRQFIGELYRNVAKLDVGARGATTTFTRQGKGDVLITWENEGYYTLGVTPRGAYELVYPSLSIRAEPPVAIVRGNAARKGMLGVAEDYVRQLYGDEGQRLIARNYYRPVYPAAADPEDLARFPEIERVRVDDPLFGGWARAQARHFAADGLFDQIYKSAGRA